MKVKEPTGETYEMPDLPAVLRALKAEITLIDPSPIAQAIQTQIDQLRPQIDQEEIARIQSWQDPATWNACRDALRPLVAQLLKDKQTITMQEIRQAAQKNSLLAHYPNSIGQRVRDLVAEGLITHLDPKIPGIYTIGQTLVKQKIDVDTKG